MYIHMEGIYGGYILYIHSDMEGILYIQIYCTYGGYIWRVYTVHTYGGHTVHTYKLVYVGDFVVLISANKHIQGSSC